MFLIEQTKAEPFHEQASRTAFARRFRETSNKVALQTLLQNRIAEPARTELFPERRTTMRREEICRPDRLDVDIENRIFIGSCSLTQLIHQLRHALIRATEAATELAVNILKHYDIGVRVNLVVGVEILSCKFVKHGCSRCHYRGRSILHFDQGHFAKEIPWPEISRVNEPA